MLVIEGRYPLEGILGTSVNNCSEILLQHKCMQAINLDGGSSAMLWFDGEYVTQSSSSPLRYTGGRPLNVQEPMHTVTSHDREAVVSAHVVKFKHDEVGTSPVEPLPTQTASGVFALCGVYLCKVSGSESLGHWPEIRTLLNRYCEYELKEDDLLLLEIKGSLFYIADIGLRML